jgi:hypothetical protein
LPAGAGDLSDPQEHAKFLREIEIALDQSLADQRRLHGRWTQDLFRAVLISLDGTTMIKDEDSGEFYIEQDEPLVLPDFLVMTHGGEQAPAASRTFPRKRLVRVFTSSFHGIAHAPGTSRGVKPSAPWTVRICR